MKRILIIDDDPDIREIAMAGFEIAGGWDAREAASGREGVELARNDPPDVILLDVMMPGIDGPTTAAQLQSDARTRHVPIIYLSAKIHLANRDRVCGFISKPFNPLTLPADVAALMASRIAPAAGP